MGLKVFLSYGHDANAALVQRIKADLETAGHQPWIDTAGIKFTDDWRRAILAGITASDCVLAFLSKHSTRDPGVCLDELAIALHVKGGNIATVLVEPETEVRPLVSVGHIQWLDMSDWAARQAADPAAFERWYCDKRDTILAHLANRDTSGFAGEIADLSRRLLPVPQAADIPPLIEGFVGRLWLLRQVDDWRKTGTHRIFWLTGGPGTGKSAFAAWLTHSARTNVIGLNLCQWNNADRRDPLRIFRTLAFLIATRLPDYRGLLLDQLRHQDADGTELRTKGPVALFQWLLAEPLHKLIDGGRRDDRMVLAIDALDETMQGSRCELAELLAECAPKLPAWIALLVTSRRLPPIERQFAAIHAHPIDAAAGGNDGDVRVYAQGWLGAADQPRLDRVVRAAEGNFLYLRKLREAVDEGWIDLDTPGPLPRGLVGLYERWFRRHFPTVADYEPFVPVLQVLVAARHPVPEALLAEMFHWPPRERERMLARLAGLFERRPDGVAPFHASLRDWLTDPRHAGEDFFVDAREGSRLLAEALWQRLVALLDTPAGTLPDDFTLAELPTQIGEQDAAALRACLAAAGSWVRLAATLRGMISISQRNYGWRSAQDWLRMFNGFAGLSGESALSDRRWGLVESGDILATLGETASALEAYRRSKLVAERLVALAPENVDWQRDLSVSQDRIGDVLVAQGALPEALAAFRASMTIAQNLAAQDPGNAGCQRDVLVSLFKLATVAVAARDCVEARRIGQEAVACGHRLVEQFLHHPGFPRDLQAVEALWRRIEAACP